MEEFMQKCFQVLMTMLLVVLVSCAHKKQHTEELEDYSFKRYSKIKEDVFKIIDQHEDYDDKKKAALKKSLGSGFEDYQEIAIEQSKLSQLFLDTLLVVGEKDVNKINSIKTSMKNLYNKRYDIFLKTSMELKGILGVKSDNNLIIREINPYINRY
jgi:hypothetical protein